MAIGTAAYQCGAEFFTEEDTEMVCFDVHQHLVQTATEDDITKIASTRTLVIL